jgi:hypothetical protein
MLHRDQWQDLMNKVIKYSNLQVQQKVRKFLTSRPTTVLASQEGLCSRELILVTTAFACRF